MYELVYPNAIALSVDRSTGVITLREAIDDDVETKVNVSSVQHRYTASVRLCQWSDCVIIKMYIYMDIL